MRERGMAVGHVRAAFWGLWALLLVVQLWLAWSLPLFGDEAFYWLEGRQPAWAHDDVPALTPLLIAFGTALAGDSPLGVRLPFILIGALTALWWMRIARHLLGARAGARVGILALLLPLFAVNGLLALPDVPLTLAVLACAEGLRRLQASDGRSGHLLLAAGLAFGWLSHYRFVVPCAAGGLWLLLDPRGRALLRQPRLYLAGAVGGALGLAPLVWHHVGHAGRGFGFQFAERHPWRFQFEGLVDPLLQALAVTPGLFALMLIGGTLAWRHRRDTEVAAMRPLTMIGGLIVLLYLLLAPFVDTERSRVHWPMPGWLLLSLLLPLATRSAGRWMRALLPAAVGLAGLAVALAFGWLAVAAQAPARLAAGALYPHNFVAWPQIAARVDAARQALPPSTVLVADNFMLAAQLEFALGVPVYSLDHASNHKHGRAGELRRLGRDVAALARTGEAPRLIVLDESATRLRERPDWFAGLCRQFAQAQPAFELVVHGRKRFIGYIEDPQAPPRDCAPPALAYVHRPAFGARVAGALAIDGWALRDRVGIVRMQAWLDDQLLGELDYGRAVPGVQAMFVRSDDPHHPHVGFDGLFVPALPAGRYLLRVVAMSGDGEPMTVATLPLHWAGRGE